MQPEIVIARLDHIDPNPFRDLGTYPPIIEKVEALKQSFSTVGVWPSIIVRAVGERFQQAFGHQRVLAARELKLAEIPVIVENDLTDEQMVQYMGRENGEDYNADVMIMLNTWEAGLKFLSLRGGTKAQPIVIARLLGWTRFKTDEREQLNNTSETCHAAHSLIEQGHLSRQDLAGLSLKAAREIVERTMSRMELLDKRAPDAGHTPDQVKAAKKSIARGAKDTAEEYRAGRIAVKDLRNQVDIRSFGHARGTKAEAPLFSAFGKALADKIDSMLRTDHTAERLEQVLSALSQVSLEEDWDIVRKLHFNLGEVSVRAIRWQNRMVKNKVVQLKLADKSGGNNV